MSERATPRPTGHEEAARWRRSGGDGRIGEMFPLVYDVLRRIARRKLAGERRDRTLLCTTDLVHEAYVKLARLNRIEWQNRAHFLALAARAMRNILVDYALQRKAHKRGGGRQDGPLDEAVVVAEAPTADLLALHEAVQRLEALDPRQGRVVECRFFAGMSVEETALALGISPASVKRDWAQARAWLNRELAR